MHNLKQENSNKHGFYLIMLGRYLVHLVLLPLLLILFLLQKPPQGNITNNIQNPYIYYNNII